MKKTHYYLYKLVHTLKKCVRQIDITATIEINR